MIPTIQKIFCATLLQAVIAATSAHARPSIDPALAELPLSAVDRALLTFESTPTASTLADLTATGLVVSSPFSTLPIVVVEGTVAALIQLEDMPGLRSVYLDRPQALLLDLTVPKVTGNGAAYTLDCDGAMCDGAGVAVAVIDTGVDGSHPDLCMDGSALAVPLAADALCPGQTPVMLQNVEVLTDDPMNPVVVEGLINTDQTGGHGTHVASIVAGQGVASARFTGVAPGAKLVGVSAGDAVAVLNTTLAIEWVIQNKDTYGIRVINNSWGSTAGAPYDPAHPVIVASSAARAAGLVVIFSAGNSGPATDSMNMYSQNPDVLSVGAGANRTATADDIAQGNLIPRDPIEDPAAFSAVGVPGSVNAHPDLLAPGQFILAARASTGFAGAQDAATDPLFMTDPNELQYYTTHSGTSMAAPHVSGIAAMVWQAALSVDSNASAETIVEILLNASNPFQDGTPLTIWQEYRAGRGYLDGLAAVNEALVNLSAYSDGANDIEHPNVADDVIAFGGAAGDAAAGGSCPGTVGAEDPAVPREEFEVFPNALTMDVMIGWTLAVNDLELCLYGPGGVLTSGLRVESDTASSAVDREHILSPATGQWVVEVRGNAGIEPFDGFVSVLYPRIYGATVQLDLDPMSATRDTGQVHAITAVITDQDGPVAAATVDWQLSGVGEVVMADAVSDANGEATMLITSSDAGATTVSATVGNQYAQSTVLWEQPPVSDETTGKAWGRGRLSDDEKLNLNVKRKRSGAAITGHLKFKADDDDDRFKARNFLSFAVNGSVATIVAEGRWDDDSGYVAIVVIDDQGNPGAGADSFDVEIREGSETGPIVAAAAGVISSGNLKVE